ncbi:MAG TPA: nitroreductase family protein [Dehalococcoidia bacterium]|jgi:coenzyme F420-0:L-glutamate ligase/coenzyme F420-1:gamma-L-glutamate ligase
MDAIEAIVTRRSLRQLSDRPVPHTLVDDVLELAATAPAPHHTRPWRYVIVLPRSRERLAEAMGHAWRADLERDGHAPELVEKLLRKSHRQIVTAPALLLACLTHEGLRDWPDERRARNEWAMAQQSIGAAMQNVMLGAHALGLSSYWISAPLFAPEACAEALALPDGYVAQAFIVLGYARDGSTPKPRPAADLSQLVIER